MQLGPDRGLKHSLWRVRIAIIGRHPCVFSWAYGVSRLLLAEHIMCVGRGHRLGVIVRVLNPFQRILIPRHLGE
jgi:hypothetical protein